MKARILLYLIMVSISLNAFAQRVDLPAVKHCIESKDMDGINRIVSKLEEDWKKTQGREYIIDMTRVFDQLANRAYQDSKWFGVLLRISSQFMSKADRIKDEDRRTFVGNGSNIVFKLHNGLGMKPIITSPDWLDIRARTMRTILIFVRYAGNRYNPDYTFPMTYVNILPPNGSGGLVAGVSPEAIKDPKLRAEYEERIAQNGKNMSLNGEQRKLAEFMKDGLPKIKESIVAAYSVKPIAYFELNEYLILGGFTIQDRNRIISKVAEATKVIPPVALLPDPKLEKK